VDWATTTGAPGAQHPSDGGHGLAVSAALLAPELKPLEPKRAADGDAVPIPLILRP